MTVALYCLGLVLLALAVMIGLAIGRGLHDQDQAAKHRDQTRLKIIETQLGALRAMLRMSQAEYRTHQRMQAEARARDVFANPTTYEEPDEWR